MSKPKDFTGKAPIYQQWGEKDFAFDTMQMHWLGRLLYKDLLTKAWYLSTRPDLPADDIQLQNILGVTPEVWQEHKDAVRAMFTLDVAAGVLWQKRLRNDWRDLYIYRQEQKKRADKGWAARKALQIKDEDAKALPRQSDGYASKAEQSRVKDINQVQNTQDDDVAPDASLGVATLPGESTPTPAPPSAPADKESQCVELTAFVFSKTGFQPPSQKMVRDLLDRYSLAALKNGLMEAVWGKNKSDVLGTVKLFFQGGAPGIILRVEQKEFLENLKSELSPQYDLSPVREFEEFLESRPAGISESTIRDARRSYQQRLNAKVMKS
jgi:uncharacterized protein YdaU (DUF1376 family)